ncbi:hypothetical protein GW17_00043540 [Ensete ventricosum]|nr:hypothetical protein GW17_00043540 [Ensete ventricosum]RZS22335.1 hypothetical protein BHM03_00055092 [Ensete ventricosum]
MSPLSFSPFGEKKSPAGNGSFLPAADDGSGEQCPLFFLQVLPFLLLFFSLFFFLLPSADTARNQLPPIEIDRYHPTATGDDRNRPLPIDFGW